jgi:hypothetical protein
MNTPNAERMLDASQGDSSYQTSFTSLFDEKQPVDNDHEDDNHKTGKEP